MLPSRQAAPLVWQSADGNDALAGDHRDDVCARSRRDDDADGVLILSLHSNNDVRACSRGVRNRSHWPVRGSRNCNVRLFHRCAYPYLFMI